MCPATYIQITVLIDCRIISSDFCAGGVLAVNGGFAVVVGGSIVTVNLCAGAAVADGAVAFVINNRLVAVDLNADGLRIGDGHGAVIAVDFRASCIVAINGGFAAVIRRGVVTVNLRAGAAVADGAVTFVINNPQQAGDLKADRLRIGES
ncbi:hypothetical protein, partial [Escherichia sp. E14S1]|uniref:hypothetical protein n=1 Tax=Escherichia sp. E14S1 TaxID=2478968 RepID=UPI001F0E7B60